MKPGCAALALAAAVTLAGCTSGGGTGDSARSTPPGTPGPVFSSVAPSSAAPTPAVPPTARGDCVASVEEATVRPAEPPGATCLVVGATLRIVSAPAPGRPWQPLSVSDSTVLECASAVAGDGSVSGSCTARRAGTAVVSTATERRPGGPDPSDHVWQLTVRVVA